MSSNESSAHVDGDSDQNLDLAQLYISLWGLKRGLRSMHEYQIDIIEPCC